MNRRRLLVALALLVLLAGGVLLWLSRPRTDEERVLAVHEDLIEAFVDEDFDEVWDLMCRGSRGIVQATRSNPRGGGPYELDEDLFGLDLDEIERMNAKEFFIAVLERGVARHPAESRALRDQIAALEVVGIAPGDHAGSMIVTCRGELLGRTRDVTFGYGDESGGWRAVLPAYSTSMKFLTLERKLDCWIAKSPVDAADIDLFLEIGPGPVEEADTARLRDHVRSLEKEPMSLVIVVDAAPTAPLQSVISVLDALVAAGAGFHHLASAVAPGPPPGLRINGVAADAPRIPGPPRDHPALRRILCIGD